MHTDTDIERGQRYTYRVIALSYAGESERSGARSITVPYIAADLAPQDLTAGLTVDSMGSPTGASLGWEAPLGEGSDVTGYKILRSVGGAEATELASVLSSVTTYADTTATTAGQVYTYEVVAVRDSAESLPSGPRVRAGAGGHDLDCDRRRCADGPRRLHHLRLEQAPDGRVPAVGGAGGRRERGDKL